MRKSLSGCRTAVFRLECGHGLFRDYYVGAGKTRRKALHSRAKNHGLRCVLEQLASGMTHEEILQAFPYLTEQDIRACLAFAADRERRVEILNA